MKYDVIGVISKYKKNLIFSALPFYTFELFDKYFLSILTRANVVIFYLFYFY